MEIKFEIDSGINIFPLDYPSKLVNLSKFPNGVPEDALEFDLFPSVRDLAIICDLSYSSNAIIEESLKENQLDYQLLCCVEKGSHHGSAFFREAKHNSPVSRHRQLIIAFRGTEELDYGDWEANLQGVVKNQKTPQINSAITFALRIVEEIYRSETPPSLSNPLQIIVTGHSLGGWLAQLATFAIKHLQLPDEGGNLRNFEKIANQEGRCHPHCVTFDSPGTKLILQYVCDFPEIKFPYDHLKLDIVNYVMFPNAVNVVNPYYGDMVQIYSPQIEHVLQESKKATTYVADTLEHTSNFHGIAQFVHVLNIGLDKIPLKHKPYTEFNKNSWWNAFCTYAFAKVFKWLWGPVTKFDWNSIPSDIRAELTFKMVIAWPVVVFEGYNTKLDTMVKHAQLQIFKTGIKELKNDPAFKEYNAWLQKRTTEINSISEPINPGAISLSAIRLSEQEKVVIDRIETIRYWKFFLAKEHSQTLEELVDDKEVVKKMLENETEFKILLGRITFENDRKYRQFKNFTVFYTSDELVSVVNRLPDYETAGVILNGASYIDSELDKYPGIEFSGDDLEIYFNPEEHNVRIWKSDCKHSLRLQLLKWMFIKRKQNQQKKLMNTLILKYTTPFKVKFESLLNTKLVIIDCIDVDPNMEISDDKIERFKRLEHCNYVWIKHMTRRTIGTWKPSLITDHKLLDSILSKEILIQGQRCTLAELVVDEEKMADFKNQLNSDCNFSKSILEFFSGNAEVAKMPKTLFEDKSTYFEVRRTIKNNSELLNYYGKGVSNSGVVFFLADDNDVTVEHSVSNFLLDKGIFVIILQLDTNGFESIFEKFKKICIAEPLMTIDLISCSNIDRDCKYKLMFQYNPNFYKKREVLASSLKIGLICKNFTSWNIEECREEIKQKECGEIKTEETCLNELKRLEETFHLYYPKVKETKIVFVDCSPRRGYKLKVKSKETTSVERVEKFYPSVKIDDDQIFMGCNFLVLSDEPGMGKSTTIYKLAAEMVKEFFSTPSDFEETRDCKPKTKLIIFIELKTLKNLDKVVCNSKQFLETLMNCISTNQRHSMITKFIARTLCETGDVILICDGFDEMEKNNKMDFRFILKNIQKSQKLKLIITTRQRDSRHLQMALNILAHRFVPFDNVDVKIDFLMTLWSSALRYSPPGNVNDCILRGFAKEVICRAHLIIVKDREEFLGVPLQLRILAFVFLPTAMKYIEDYGKPNSKGLGILETNYTLVDIYDKFIARKFELYICHKNGLSKDSGYCQIGPYTLTYLEQKMIFLACNNLGWKKYLEELFIELYGKLAASLTYEEEDVLFGVGLIYGSNIEIQFIHRTFAEFYVSKLLFFAIKEACFNTRRDAEGGSKEKPWLLNNICSYVLSSEGEVVRLFLNTLIEKSFGLFSEGNCKVLGDIDITNMHNIFNHIIEKNQAYILDFLLTACNVSDISSMLDLIKYCKFNFTKLDSETREPPLAIYILLNRLYKICKVRKKDFQSIKFLWVDGDKFHSVGSKLKLVHEKEQAILFLELFHDETFPTASNNRSTFATRVVNFFKNLFV